MPYTKAGHLLNPLRILLQSPKKMLDKLELKKDSTVLELGCGPGYFSIELARAIPQGKLVLFDIQQEMLDMAKKRMENAKIINVEYLQGDACVLPMKNREFDAVLMASVLGEISDRNACLQEVIRVLRPGGLLAVTELKAGDPHAIKPSEIRQYTKEAGFIHHKIYRGLLQSTSVYVKSLWF